ncbi:MAG: RES family NAD+ phosphorylase [Desulfuromonadaceae bacterium]
MFQQLLTAINDYSADLYRNIKTARVSIDCFADLGDGAFDTQVAVQAEMAGHEDSHAATLTRPFDYGTVIAYSFDARHWQASRFSDGASYGVWYGAETLETTIHETAYHWRQFVRDAFGNANHEIVSDRRVVLARCQGLLIDLVGKEDEFPALIDPNDYGFTQQVGNYLVRNRQSGLLVKSARCEGINAAIFHKEILSNPRDFCYLTYFWNPATGNEIRVERELGTTLMSIK